MQRFAAAFKPRRRAELRFVSMQRSVGTISAVKLLGSPALKTGDQKEASGDFCDWKLSKSSTKFKKKVFAGDDAAYFVNRAYSGGSAEFA